MANVGASESANARAELDNAFAQRDRYNGQDRVPRIGIFGNGVPEVLIAAAGVTPVHLNMATSDLATDGESEVDAVIEPFVDAEVRRFLQRLVAGAFADCQGIVFARDDAPALIAYQYATEWVRQGKASDGVPPMFLWNLVHTSTPAARAFNQTQSDKLFAFLAGVGLRRPSSDDVAGASADEAARADALERLDAAMGETVSGETALRWRNAGRFMSATDHARLIAQALSGDVTAKAISGPRIGIVGSPLACAQTYAMVETFGPIVCDLQPWGQVWPGKANTAFGVDAVLEAEAANRFCTRISPPSEYRKAMVEALVAAQCDLVLCQLSQTDDSFGWEIPNLQADLADKGIAFLNLGFRDPEPDARWRDNASKLLAKALEGRS